MLTAGHHGLVCKIKICLRIKLMLMLKVNVDICKWLDSLVFSDKDYKPKALSRNLSMFITLWDVKEPRQHTIQGVGHGVTGEPSLKKKITLNHRTK